MRIDAIFVVITEWIAFICWAIHFNKIVEHKNKLFVIYFFIIAFTETLNLVLGNINFLPLNFIVNHIIVPIEFLFLFYYLLWKVSNAHTIIFVFFSILYLSFYFLDRIQYFEKKTFFDSLSYGVGCLLIIIAVVFSVSNFLKQEAVLEFTKKSLFWILLGITIFYLGSFPYHNFRTFLWGNKEYHILAYTLHYVSQVFCCIMYLLFAYAAKWIVK